jgi:ATP-dependent Clp protease ATP-binding subunit ClpX
MADDRLRCSFCGKASSDVHTVIASQLNDARICDECIDLCNQLIVESGDDEGNPPPWWSWRSVGHDTPA